MKEKFPLWQVALATIAVSGLGALSTMKPKSAERKLYQQELKQAPWAAPPWAFGPAWTINNFFLLKALSKMLDGNTSEQHKQVLHLQVPIWAIYFSFGFVYFNKKSPILAAAWTVADAIFAAISFSKARKIDKNLSFHYLPLLGWTSFASTLALYQAAKNDDPVMNTEAVVA
jgi:translocator protein